jgi:hypothetical protein
MKAPHGSIGSSHGSRSRIGISSGSGGASSLHTYALIGNVKISFSVTISACGMEHHHIHYFIAKGN